MSTRNLAKLFRPSSVAVIGAREEARTVGRVVMQNLLQGGFSGPIMPVHPGHKSVAGVLAYPDARELPLVPDLAVLCVKPESVIDEIAKLGELGTRAAVVLSDGMNQTIGGDGRSLAKAMAETAHKYEMRVLGPNCLGLMVPGIGLNASFACQKAEPGRIAFVSQSGALCAAVLDWAHPKGIGFSHFISLGDSIDLGFGDVLDYLGSDPTTRAILLYIESIHERRNFMSAARAAARNKPVLAIKAGRSAASARATATHTGAMAGTDEVYDGVMRRAGMLRVYDLEEMFTAVETLSRSRPVRGKSLAILTNGGGIGIMAVDELAAGGGFLAEFGPETIAKLDRILPPLWSKSNPIDILGDADGERYVKTLDILYAAPEVDSILVMHAPSALTESSAIAAEVVKSVKSHRGNVMTCWVGQEKVAEARRLFNEAGIPSYETPGAAVSAFLHLVKYRKNQDMLMETPSSVHAEVSPDLAGARALIAKALERGDSFLTEPESKALLSAYGIPSVAAEIAASPREASRIAQRLGTMVVLKVLSPDISHKSDVGGVMLNLQGPFEVEKAAYFMQESIAASYPDVHISGFTVQPMIQRPRSQELLIGVATDPVFGPVIMFGQGGVAAEVIADSAIGLPPLNMTLARELMQRTRIWGVLQGYRDRPPAAIDAVCQIMTRVSQMIVDLPEIVEMDINPLLVDQDGALALDARFKVAAGFPPDRLAIRPYPKELEEILTLADGSEVILRPIRPEDEPSHHEFHSRLTTEDIRFRFFGLVAEVPHSEMARMTQIDYDREMAFIAKLGATEETLGVARAIADPDNEKAEFAVIVRSDLKGSGIGRLLMKKLIAYCRTRGTGQIVGQVLTENQRMLKFCESLGFVKVRYVEGDIVELALDLRAPATAAPPS